MDTVNIEDLKEYERLMIVKREAEVKIEELKPKIIPFIPEDKEVQMEHGYFYLQSRPTWKYTSAVEDFEKQVKKMKAGEQARGDAKVEYTATLYYKTGKPETEDK